MVAKLACRQVQPEKANIISLKTNTLRFFARLANVGYFSVACNALTDILQ